MTMEHQVANLNNTLINFFKGVATARQLDEFCGNENVFSYTRIPRRRLPVEIPQAGARPSAEAVEDDTIPNREGSIRSKILSHFIKGRVSLTPMETVMMIPGELEQLENLVKVARRKKDAKLENTQVRRGPGTDVEVLPLTMVNLIQRSDPEYDVYNKGTTGKSVPTNLEANDELLSWCALASSPSMTTQEPESETNSNEESDEESQQGSSIEIESEFGDTGLEILVSSEGPQQILQITLQNQANEVMKEELSDADNYADWIRWAADGEHCKQNPSGAANVTRKSVLLQVQQIEVPASSSTVKKEITEDLKGKGRWKDISQKLRIDQGLDKLKRPLL
ncbi:unnamed protein product [Sphagnum jensenii]|uniref:Uncharacterized protein n=1 Tax=Sphagnum jensenii TaxID=128206 RepID=A0ABP0VHA1_9BRYO